MKEKSTVDINHFFEGSEKLLEIWFGPVETESNLRKIAHDDIVNVLNLVNCQIVSSLTGDHMDSYVLSESSLFISKRRIILKTCGTTYLLKACPIILKLGLKMGFESYQIYYSRRKFLLPEIQPELHRNFYKEVNYLDDELGICGSAYTFGPLNDECWNLYVSDQPAICDENDQTFEVIMTGLDPCKAAKFFKSDMITNGKDVTKITGICDIYPDADIDDYLFEPCGYSMNGIIEEDKYLTIHVTPEDDFSYASFETNYSGRDYTKVLQKLLGIFGPKKFFMTFVSEIDSSSDTHTRFSKFHQIMDYNRRNWQRSILSNVDITFAYFVRNPG